MMEKTDFGIRKDGRTASLYTIENDGFRLSASDHGATLVSFVVKAKNRDVVQGAVGVSAYEEELRYMGGSIGRVCNRIRKGTFAIDGVIYHVPANNGPNALHGGPEGFNDRLWDCEMTEDSLIFRLVSPDGDQGFPGQLEAHVTYRLLPDGFAYCYQGTSSRDTLFAMTNHAYFNLHGPASDHAMDHVVQSDAPYFYTVDRDGLTCGRKLPCEGTPMDFRTPHEAGERIDADYEPLLNGSGYDHHYSLTGQGMRKAAVCSAGGITMTVETDLPGFHLYTANFLDGTCRTGKQGGTFPRRSSICFETEYTPDAIHLEDAQVPLLKAGETACHTTNYHFMTEGE